MAVKAEEQENQPEPEVKEAAVEEEVKASGKSDDVVEGQVVKNEEEVKE